MALLPRSSRLSVNTAASANKSSLVTTAGMSNFVLARLPVMERIGLVAAIRNTVAGEWQPKVRASLDCWNVMVVWGVVLLEVMLREWDRMIFCKHQIFDSFE